jgi:hypothetical protein
VRRIRRAGPSIPWPCAPGRSAASSTSIPKRSTSLRASFSTTRHRRRRVFRRRAGQRLRPLHQPHGHHLAGAAGGARRRRGLHRHGQRHGGDPVDRDGADEGGRAHRRLAQHLRRHAATCSATSCRASASRPVSSTRAASRPFAPRCARHPAGVHRDAVESAHRGLRHRGAGRSRACRGRPAGGRQLLLHAGPAASLQLGADLMIHSATKYLDGQGRVLGGAVCGSARR